MPYSLNNFSCVDPDAIVESGQCNSYVCPIGEGYGVAKVLMFRHDYEKIPSGRHNLTLTIVDTSDNRLTIPFLHVIELRTAHQTSLSRQGSIVELTLADWRWSYRNVSTDEAYNFRGSSGTIEASTTNGGTNWTWQGIVNDLWGKINTAYGGSGAAPLFPTTPAGTPEGFAFQGVDVWTALNRVVQAAGFVLVYNATDGVVSIRDPDTDAPAMPDGRRASRTYDDGAWTDERDWELPVRMPTTLAVYFPVPNSPYGLATDTSLSQGVDASAKAVVWDDMPAYSGTNDTARTQRAAAVAKLWQIDYFSRANKNTIEFLGWQRWVLDAIGYSSWSEWAVYDRGRAGGKGVAGVLTAITNRKPLRMDNLPDPYSYMAFRLNTQNVDGTQVEPDTRDIRFDQATFIQAQQLTGPKRTRVFIDVAGLGDAIKDDIAPDIIDLVQASGTWIEVVECVYLIANPDGTYELEVKKRNLLVLDVGPEQECITPEECCPPPATNVPCCPNDIPEVLSLTVSGGGGSYPATWDGTAWDTGLITIPGCGTARLRLSCEGTSAGDFVVGNIGTAQCVFSTGIGGTTVTCNPFSAQFVGTFSGIGCSCGSKTLTWTPPA